MKHVIVAMLFAMVGAEEAVYREPEHRQLEAAVPHHQQAQGPHEYYPQHYYQQQPQSYPRPGLFAKAIELKENLLDLIPQPDLYELSLFVSEVLIATVAVLGLLYGIAFLISYITGREFKIEIGKSFPSLEDAAPFFSLATDVLKQIEQASSKFEGEEE